MINITQSIKSYLVNKELKKSLNKEHRQEWISIMWDALYVLAGNKCGDFGCRTI